MRVLIFIYKAIKAYFNKGKSDKSNKAIIVGNGNISIQSSDKDVEPVIYFIQK